jgi:DNA-binding transcriptional MerR regulator
MAPSLAIGHFSRATHLNIKTLRHYHRIGLLEPADVDPDTGHRRYGTDQIPTAQIIRRLRALEMPLEEIHAVIKTSDPAVRNQLIASHLQRLEETLERTQQAAASLRDLLEPPIDAAPIAIEHRRIPATSAAAVTQVIDVRDATGWYQGALGELHALLNAQRITPSGPGGAIYATELFTHGRGEATVFVPCNETVRATGRVTALVVPEVDLALTVHPGPHNAELDRAYGALATYVTDHTLAIEGPIREYYLIGPHETDHQDQWQTEIGWPIFHTGQPNNPATNQSSARTKPAGLSPPQKPVAGCRSSRPQAPSRTPSGPGLPRADKSVFMGGTVSAAGIRLTPSKPKAVVSSWLSKRRVVPGRSLSTLGRDYEGCSASGLTLYGPICLMVNG